MVRRGQIWVVGDTWPDRRARVWAETLTTAERTAIDHTARAYLRRPKNRLTRRQAVHLAGFQAYQVWFWEHIAKPRRDAARAKRAAERKARTEQEGT